MDNGEFIFSPILSIIEISAAEYRGGDFFILDNADEWIFFEHESHEKGEVASLFHRAMQPLSARCAKCIVGWEAKSKAR